MKKRIILGLTCGLILLIGGSIILKNFNKDNSVMVSSNNDININDVNKEYYNEISANSEFINEEKEENNSNNSEDIMENTNNNTVISISNEDFNANSDTIANNKKEELNLNDDTTTNNKREELSQTSDNSTNYTKDNTNDMIWNKENNEFENTEIEATISVNTKKIRIEKGTSQDVYVSCYPEATDFLQVGGMSKNTNIAHCTGDTKDITKFTIYGSCVGTTTVEFSYHAGTSQGWIYTYLNVEVFENKVSGITLDKSSVEVSVGHIINLTPTLSPNNATNKNVIWSSSDTSIVTVKDGVVRGIKEGQAIITATSEDGKYTAKCLVTVKFVHATGLEIRLEGYFSTYNVKIGETYKAIALVKPVNASNEDVVWESSDQSVATIDNDGNVKIVGKGIAHISATTVDGNISSNVIIFDSM